MLVGGCAVGLLIDNPAATPPRVTYDVDLLAEVAAIPGYQALEREFARRGFVKAVALLEGGARPEAAEDCEWCEYVTRRQECE